MTLNVSNHNGALVADHFWIHNLFQEFSTQKLVFGLSEHVLTIHYRGSGWLSTYKAYVIDVLA